LNNIEGTRNNGFEPAFPELTARERRGSRNIWERSHAIKWYDERLSSRRQGFSLWLVRAELVVDEWAQGRVPLRVISFSTVVNFTSIFRTSYFIGHRYCIALVINRVVRRQN